MFKFFETRSSPLVSVMMDGAGSENLIVSPFRAFFSAARKEPAPVSEVVVTVRVLAVNDMHVNMRLAVTSDTTGMNAVFML